MVDFYYAVSNIRVKETRLLHKDLLMRMLNSKTAENAYSLFSELDYGELLSRFPNTAEYNDLIDHGLWDTKKEIVAMTPQSPAIDFLWRKYDYHNLKVLFKHELMGAQAGNRHRLYSGLGSISKQKMHTLESAQTVFPKARALFAMASDIYNETQNPQFIDFLLDKAYLQDLLEMAGENVFLKNSAKYMIDAYNMVTFLRLRGTKNISDKVLKQVFCEWGNVRQTEFEKGFHKSQEHMYKVIKASFTSSKMKIYFGNYLKHGSLFHLQMGMLYFLASYFYTYRLVSTGPEPILSYWYTRENHAQILRMLMAGKLSGMSADDISQKLPVLF